MRTVPFKYRFAQALAIAMVTAYVLVLWCQVPWNWKSVHHRSLYKLQNQAREFTMDALKPAYRLIGFEETNRYALHAGYLILTGVAIPWLAWHMLGRGQLGTLGVRSINRVGWRILFVSYIVALGPVLWMAQSPGFDRYYLDQIERISGRGFLAYYFFSLIAEHFLCQGFILAAFRVGGRWPASPDHTDGGSNRAIACFRWIGLAQPTSGATGMRAVRRWLGLRPHCAIPILFAGFVFGLLHLGKDPREFMLSFPGGVALAYIAYRTNSLFTPMLLHTATAGTAMLAIGAFSAS